MPRPPKTVYILGAGFSIPAGLPSQGELVDQILDYSLPGKLKKCKTTVLKFILEVYGLNKTQAAQLALEDIYTPIHQCITNGEYLKAYSPQKLRTVENHLNQLIAHVLDNGKKGVPTSYEYIKNFARKFVDTNCQNISNRDSIISLNWDILLEKAFNGNGRTIDYGCEYAFVKQSNPVSHHQRIPIRFLKLHGSLNWVTCPRCNRLFANMHAKEGIKAFEGSARCPRCSDVKLDATLLLPSFRKDLRSLHFQQIWNQAARELSEATKLVFLGYSFPLADFDFRSLITKSVEDVKVEVVLYSEEDSETEEGRRYRNYFGNKLTSIQYDGVENYLSDHSHFTS